MQRPFECKISQRAVLESGSEPGIGVMVWPHASFLRLSVSSPVKWANDGPCLAAFGEDEVR